MSPTPRPFLVGVAGGRDRGASTLVRTLTALLGAERVSTLAYAAYACDRSDPSAAPPAVPADDPEALDTEAFLEDLAALRAQRSIRPPRSGAGTGRRLGPDPVEPRPIVLVEGVLLLHDPRVRALLDLTIFLDVPDAARPSRRSGEPDVADLVLLDVGRLDRLAEIAATVILDRVERRARSAAA